MKITLLHLLNIVLKRDRRIDKYKQKQYHTEFKRKLITIKIGKFARNKITSTVLTHFLEPYNTRLLIIFTRTQRSPTATPQIHLYWQEPWQVVFRLGSKRWPPPPPPTPPCRIGERYGEIIPIILLVGTYLSSLYKRNVELQVTYSSSLSLSLLFSIILLADTVTGSI